MKPLDPRLLRYASAARGFLALAVLLGLVHILLVLAFAWLLAAVLTTAIGAVAGPPISEFPVPELPGLPAGAEDSFPIMIAALAGVVLLRSVVSWGTEAVSARTAVTVKSQLRRRAAAALAGSLGLTDRGSNAEAARGVTVLGTGLDALDTYFSRYLPQLVLTVLAIPLHLLVLALYDMTTAVIVAITMPLIPVFMVLIGWTTQSAQQRQWARLNRLSRAYLDIVEGLSTLKIFNRQGRQRQNLARISEAHRRSTMKVLRVSFLSGFVLELAASLSVALVAVSIGVRLIDGTLGLFVGLFALLIVPEAYAPLRQVGANYHAAADGLAAAEDVFEILEAAPVPFEGRVSVGKSRESPGIPTETRPPNRGREGGGLRISGLTVRREERPVLRDFSAEIPAGRVTVITGPSGAGKSTLFAALLGLVPSAGLVQLCTSVSPEGTSAADDAVDPGIPLTREHIAWSGQRSGLRSGTVLENIALGESAPDPALARLLIERLGLEDLILDAPLGVRGEGLSGGQAHRVAIVRALYRARRKSCPVLLLDEPSAALDAEAEARLLRALRQEAEAGRIVIVISHRPAVEAAADRCLALDAVPGATQQALHQTQPEAAETSGAEEALRTSAERARHVSPS